MTDTHFLFGKLSMARQFYSNAKTNYSFALTQYITSVLVGAREVTNDKKFTAYVDDCSLFHGNTYGNNIASVEIDKNDIVSIVESTGNKSMLVSLDLDDMEQVARYVTSVFNNVCSPDNRELISYYPN